MRKKTKRQFHCDKCNSPCTIYKHGKKHRVLVCPECGVLATNPFSIKGALKGGARGAIGSIPVAGGAILGAFDGSQPEKVAAAPSRPSNRFSTEERVALALHGRL